jgi:hypothetical protein
MTVSPYTQLFESLITNKNITIYTSASKVIKFNSDTNSESGSNGAFYNFTNSYLKGKFTGLITILPITGGTLPTIIVRGGEYSPVITVPFNSLSLSSIPLDYGFANGLTRNVLSIGGSFKPKIYISDVPNGFDILSTGGL